MELTSIYLHIPFCKQRCAYCDFNTYAGLESVIPAYVQALCREAEYAAQASANKLPIHTIFFGGGTPSMLPLSGIEQIITTIGDEFLVQSDAEITLEANPGTLSLEFLRGLISMGINRISIGMQSALEKELRLLGRIHTFGEVIQCVEWARLAGFDNLNLDLIYGLPFQSIDDWSGSMGSALGLQPEHFSLYALTLEEETPMAQWVKQGLLAEQDADLAADMYELAGARLEKAGYESYEISNWASYDHAGRSYACRHNLQYWRGKPYLGFGAGAHGYANHTRTVNVLTPMAYIQKMGSDIDPRICDFPVSPAASEYTILSPQEEMGEYMMMGLRLTQEGVADKDFTERFGQSLVQSYDSKIQRFIKLGLLEWVDESNRRLRLTIKGRLLGNQVFCEFI
jgi:oxygen-independent coproporphyrinogen-3 oxidase